MTDPAVVQRRTLWVLFFTQIISGIGVGIGVSVGALLTADLAGISVSGLAQSTVVVGGALFAIPATSIVQRYGRRPSLALCYFAAALGSMLVVIAATRGWIPLLFVALFLFGGATAAGFQARYAAVDLAPPELRGRHLALILWATTLGAVAGPNLAKAAGTALAAYGVPTLAGPFFFSSLLFGLAAVVLALLLRPDPAILARDSSVSPLPKGGGTKGVRTGMRAALQAVLASPSATVGVSAMAVGHLIMVGVMAMTPVHIRGAGHDAAHTLRIVGVVISVHIAGMYAFSPLVGWLADRVGRRPVILVGIALLLSACALAGTAGHNSVQLAAGLTLLGLGWSATMVAGSTLLTESVSAELRASAQGLSDLTMGLAGASAGALSGVIVSGPGYPTLSLVAALTTAPLLLLVAFARLRPGISS